MRKTPLRPFIENHNTAIGIFIFILTVFFTHAPFFLFIPVPGFGMDTFGYYWAALEIYRHHLPLTNSPIDLPLGYPLFLTLLKWLGGNITQVVLTQVFIFTAAGSYLIVQFSKTLKFGGLIAAIGLMFFTLNPFTLRHNLTLYTESLYTSGLLFLVGSILFFFRRKTLWAFCAVLAGVFWAMFVRSNGIVMLLIPALLILHSYFVKTDYKLFALAFLTLVLADISLNYFLKGTISFADSKRIEKVISNLEKRYSGVSSTAPVTASLPPENTSAGMFKKYFWSIVDAKPSFYYSLLNANYRQVIAAKMPEDSTLRMFNNKMNVDSFSPGLQKFIFENYDSRKFENAVYADAINYQHRPRNLWIFANHIVYQAFSTLKLNYIFYLLFWLFVFYAVYQIFFLRSGNEIQLIILFLSTVHLPSLFLLPFIHSRFQLRYIHVSEFVVYLIAGIGLYYFFTKNKRV